MQVSELLQHLCGNFHPLVFALKFIVLLLQVIYLSFGHDWNDHDVGFGLSMEKAEAKMRRFNDLDLDRYTRSLNPWYLLYEREYARHAGSHHKRNESNVILKQIPSDVGIAGSQLFHSKFKKTNVEKLVNLSIVDRYTRSLNPWYLLYEREYARHAGTHRKSNKSSVRFHQVQLNKYAPQDKLYSNKLKRNSLKVKRYSRSLNPWYLLYELEYAKHKGTHHKLNENLTPGDGGNKNIYKRQIYTSSLNNQMQKIFRSMRKDRHADAKSRSTIDQHISKTGSPSNQEENEKTRESINELMHLYTKIGHMLNPLIEMSNKSAVDLTNGSLSSGSANTSNAATNNTQQASVDSFQSALPKKSESSGNTPRHNDKIPTFTHFVTELSTSGRKGEPDSNDKSRFRLNRKRRPKTSERPTHKRRKLHYRYEHFLSEDSASSTRIPNKNLTRTKNNHLSLKNKEMGFPPPTTGAENKSDPLINITNYSKVNFSELENLLYTTLRELNATKHLPKTEKPAEENVTLTGAVSSLGKSNGTQNTSMSNTSSVNDGPGDDKSRATNVSEAGKTLTQTEISVDQKNAISAVATSNITSAFKIVISADVKSNETLSISPTNNSLIFKVIPRDNVMNGHTSIPQPNNLSLDVISNQANMDQSNRTKNNSASVEVSRNRTYDAKMNDADALNVPNDNYPTLDDVKGVNMSEPNDIYPTFDDVYGVNMSDPENEGFEDAMEDDLKSNQSKQINSSTNMQIRQQIHISNSTDIAQLNETNQNSSTPNEPFVRKNESTNSTSTQQTNPVSSLPLGNTTLNISLHFQPIDNDTGIETNVVAKEEIAENLHLKNISASATDNATTSSSIHNSSDVMPISHGVEVLQVKSNNDTKLQDEPFFIHAALKDTQDKSKKLGEHSSMNTRDKKEENCKTKTSNTCLVYHYPTKDRSESNVVIDYINDPGLEDDEDGGYARKHVESPSFKSESKQNGQPDDQVVISSHNPDPTGKPKLVKLYVDPSAERVFGKHNLLHPYYDAYNKPLQSSHTSSRSYYDHSTGEADSGGQHYNDGGNNLMCYQPPCNWSNGPQRDVPGYEG